MENIGTFQRGAGDVNAAPFQASMHKSDVEGLHPLMKKKMDEKLFLAVSAYCHVQTSA